MPRGSKPGEHRGGRKAGTPNKVTADVRAVAVKHSPEALKVLVSIATDKEAPPAARVAASREILDRAVGKPPQAITGDGGGPLIPGAVAFIIRLQAGAECQP